MRKKERKGKERKARRGGGSEIRRAEEETEKRKRNFILNCLFHLIFCFLHYMLTKEIAAPVSITIFP